MEWLKVFQSEEEARRRLVDGKPLLIVANGKRIALVRHGEEFFAVQDSCTHQGESLSNGRVNSLGEIICPWHNYRFDLMSGNAVDSACRPLTTYTTRMDPDGFFIAV